MKFPVVFRVFAVLNLLAFFILAIQAVFIVLEPRTGTLWLVIAASTAAVCFLVSALAWFFGSAKSFTYLYIAAIAIWMFVGAIIHMCISYFSSLGQDVFLVFFVYALLFFIYSLFLFLSVLLPSVKRWVDDENSKRKRFDPATTIGFVIIVGLFSSLFLYIDSHVPRYMGVDSSYNTYGPFKGCTDIDLTHVTTFDAIRVGKDQNYPGKILIHFANTYEASEVLDYFRSDTVTLEADGEYFLIASFPEVQAVKMLICESDGQPFSISGVDLLHSVAYFDKNPETEKFIFRGAADVMHENEYVDEEYYEEEYEGDYPQEEFNTFVFYDETGVKTLADTERASIINECLAQMANAYADGTGYSFRNTNGVVSINSVEFGMYSHFATLFRDDLPDAFYNYVINTYQLDGVDGLNAALHLISGLNIYQNPDESESLPFRRVSPAFVQWLGENLIPDPQTEFAGTTAQEIYSKTFRRMLWMLATSHEYLGRGDFYKLEAASYRNAMQAHGFNGASYLYNRYNTLDVNESAFKKLYAEFPPNEEDYYYFDESVALGFWLRRYIDGSHDEVFALVQKILSEYDNYTWNEGS